jgi:hypothetical protein
VVRVERHRLIGQRHDDVMGRRRQHPAKRKEGRRDREGSLPAG